MNERDQPRAPAWMQREERGSLFWLRFMQRLSLLIGRRLSRPIVWFIALYFLLAARAPRRAMRAYLPRVLGRPANWLDLYRQVLSFSTIIHDRTFLVAGRFGAFDIRSQGVEAMHAEQARLGGMILAGAHLGSFEAIRCLSHRFPAMRVCMAMYPDNSQQLNAALLKLNPDAFADMIPLGRLDSMLIAQQRLQDGATVGLLADRASGDDTMQRVDFLGSPADFPTGPFRMAALLRQPVQFMAGLYLGGGRYDIVFEPLADFSEVGPARRDAAVRDAITRYAAVLERLCRAHPYNWFNFFDFWESARENPSSSPRS